MSIKFSIVTTAFNSEKYIGETIQSVVTQRGDFFIEYYIVDGGSTDRTIGVVREWERAIEHDANLIRCRGVTFHVISEPDEGMYDAINKGFSRATGDIYAWINSDDIYLPGAFSSVAMTFTQYEDIGWVKGITSYIDDESRVFSIGRCNLYTREWIRKGVYGRSLTFIQQDSVFWRRSLWIIAGGVDGSLRLAGDYYLWVTLAKFEELYVINAYLSCFRHVEGQLSSNIEGYRAEMQKVVKVDNELENSITTYFSKYEKCIPRPLRGYAFSFFFGSLKFNLIQFDASAKSMSRFSGDYYFVNALLGRVGD